MELRYPPTLNVDFRKLNKAALIKILKFYNVDPRKDATQPTLAVMAARIFEATVVLEDNVVDKFVDKHFHGSSGSNGMHDPVGNNLGNIFDNILGKKGLSQRELLDREPAMVGEQVAAKMTQNNEDGSWVLGNVLDYDSRSMTYTIQDEDDSSKIVTLSYCDVKRLDDNADYYRRGDMVLAVFPETTSFYRATIAKTPKPSQNRTKEGATGSAREGIRDRNGDRDATSNGNETMWDVIVRFEDDEDEKGKKCPPRRIPARFVLARSNLTEAMIYTNQQNMAHLAQMGHHIGGANQLQLANLQQQLGQMGNPYILQQMQFLQQQQQLQLQQQQQQQQQSQSSNKRAKTSHHNDD